MPTTTATPASTDRIEKLVNLDAPRSRVWRALTDVAQFNAWFGVNLSSPFTPGAAVSGKLTFKNYDHLTLTIWIETMEPERFFSFRWHPYAVEADVDYSAEPTTLCSFTLEEANDGGTRLTIVESGFDAIPEARRAKAFAMNSGGWNGQAENIRKFLATGKNEETRVAPHEQTQA
ncbi:MAG: SRPBCC family protein [Gemmatimonas sp.]